MAGADLLSNGSLFLWGGVGGLAGGAFAFTIPWLFSIMEERETKWPTLLRAFGAIGLLVTWGALGGLGALIAGKTTELGQAILFVIGWTGAFKGVSEAAYSAARGAVHRQLTQQADPSTLADG
jgi:hypothetical protein